MYKYIDCCIYIYIYMWSDWNSIQFIIYIKRLKCIHEIYLTFKPFLIFFIFSLVKIVLHRSKHKIVLHTSKQKGKLYYTQVNRKENCTTQK